MPKLNRRERSREVHLGALSCHTMSRPVTPSRNEQVSANWYMDWIKYRGDRFVHVSRHPAAHQPVGLVEAIGDTKPPETNLVPQGASY